MDQGPTINIMLAEDHTSARQAFVALLQDEPNFRVTGHAANGYELLKLIEKNEPHIVLTDLEMPVMNGSKLIETMKVRFPKVRPIVLSMYDEAEYISQLILDGACAYISKKGEFEEVVFTINKVHAEGYYFSKVISRIIISSSGTLEYVMKDLRLSNREIDVIRLICAEKSNAEIALILNISINTVSSYRQNVFRKTNAESLIGLYKYALRNGIVNAD